MLQYKLCNMDLHQLKIALYDVAFICKCQCPYAPGENIKIENKTKAV